MVVSQAVAEQFLERLVVVLEKLARDGLVQHVHHYEHEEPAVYKYEPADGTVLPIKPLDPFIR